MLVSSVHDPDVFCVEGNEDGVYRALIHDHAMHLAHCHVWLIDDGCTLASALVEKLSGSMSPILQSLAHLIESARFVRRAVDADIFADVEKMMVVSKTAATALAMASNPGVDATIVSPDAMSALGLVGRISENTYTLEGYTSSAAKQREYDSMGGVSLKGMGQKDLIDKILSPFFRWSSSVTLIDRYVCKSFFDCNPDDIDQDRYNWPLFKKTIQVLYKAWSSHCLVKKDAFEIVTKAKRVNDNWSEDWQRQWCAEGVPGNPTTQAQLLGENLDLGPGAIVKLVEPGKGSRDAQHDRFLVSSKLDRILNFTAGFDLIKPNGFINKECQVFLQRNSGAASTMLSAREKGVWRYAEGSEQVILP